MPIPNPLSPIFSFLSWRNSIKALTLTRANSEAMLKVTPVIAFPGPSDEMISYRLFNDSVEYGFGQHKTFLGIKIENEGFSSQRILEAGFVDSQGTRYPLSDWYWINAPDRKPIDFDQSCQGFPIELAPSECGEIYMMILPHSENFVFHEKAYVETDSGQLTFGISQVVSKMADRIKACVSC